MQSFKSRSIVASAAVAALALFSTTQSAFADHQSACCCQGQMMQQHHAAFQAGDKVVVSGDHAMLMKGTEKLMDVPKGHEFQVIKVQGGWLLTPYNPAYQNEFIPEDGIIKLYRVLEVVKKI